MSEDSKLDFYLRKKCGQTKFLLCAFPLCQHLLSSFTGKIQNIFPNPIVYSNKNSTLGKISYILEKLRSGAFMISDRTHYVDKFYQPSSCVYEQPVQGLLCLY